MVALKMAQKFYCIIKGRKMYKIISDIALAFLLIYFLNITIYPQGFWEMTNGPYGGQIMAAYGDTTDKVLVGTKNGLFISTDNGENWNSINSNFRNKTVISIKNFNSFIYIISDYTSIVKLSNDGLQADTIYYSLQQRPRSLEITESGKLLMSTNNNIYKSTDDGGTWVSLKDSTMSLYIPKNICSKGDSTIFFSDGNNRIYRSLNAGGDWELISGSLPSQPTTVLYLDPDGILYAAITDNKIYKSEDDGENWTSIDNNNFYSNIHSLFIKDNYFYAGNDQGIFRTTDNGMSWQSFSNGITEKSIQYIFKGGDKLYTGTTLAGIFVYNDSANQWEFKVNGLNANKVGSIVTDFQNNLFSGIYGNGVFKGTGTSPVSWENKNNGLNEYFITSLAVSANQNTQDHIYLLTENQIYKTTNLGSSWISLNTPCSYSMNSLCINDSGYLFFNSSCGVFRSVNDGSSWDLMNTNSWMGQVKLVVSNPKLSNVYVSSENGFYRSTNNGNTWSQISMNGSNALKIKINNKGHLYAVNTFGEILKSTNNGSSFTLVNNGLPLTYGYIQDLAFNSEDHIYLATKDGLYVSKNEAASWMIADQTTTSKMVNILEFDKVDRLYAGLINEGVHRSSSLLTDIEDETKVVEVYMMSNNYPNPFNPTTSIQYAITSGQFVTLKIYDVLGKEVATLVDEFRNAGSYEVEFQSTVVSPQLASGVYFYQLRAGSFIQTKKMILLK